jgi:hypothetical protein
MIDRDHELPVSKQCAALEISRGSVYYEPVAVSASCVRQVLQINHGVR